MHLFVLLPEEEEGAVSQGWLGVVRVSEKRMNGELDMVRGQAAVGSDRAGVQNDGELDALGDDEVVRKKRRKNKKKNQIRLIQYISSRPPLWCRLGLAARWTSTSSSSSSSSRSIYALYYCHPKHPHSLAPSQSPSPLHHRRARPSPPLCHRQIIHDSTDRQAERHPTTHSSTASTVFLLFPPSRLISCSLYCHSPLVAATKA